MADNSSAHASPQKADSAARVYIVAEKSFNSNVLSFYLNETEGLAAEIIQPTEFAPLCEAPAAHPRMLLIDCVTMQKHGFLLKICSAHMQKKMNCLTLLFNVDPKARIEQEIIVCGFRGVLYRNSPADFFPKAVRAVLGGELWFPRKVLERNFLCGVTPPVDGQTDGNTLSYREREILSMLAAGKSNRLIAGALRISPHTVKTHAYNIFRKINVSNRLQAALWVARNNRH